LARHPTDYQWLQRACSHW